MSHTPAEVLSRIEVVMENMISDLHLGQVPIFRSPYSSSPGRNFSNLKQSRTFTNSVLVLSFVQKLLLSHRTTTTREVYYFFITHFTSQSECNDAISSVCTLLGVERISLGLSASPKGWYCGCIEITRPSSSGNTTTTSGTCLSSIQGLPITREWIHRAAALKRESYRHKFDNDGDGDDNDADDESISDGSIEEHQLHPEADFSITSKAKCIIVVEKEGVYTRLSEDRFFKEFPCILVTGKGFPDIATRALVYTLHNLLEIPVFGLADCNPFGVAVLRTYITGGKGVDGGDRYSVPIQWLGLRPSQLAVDEDEDEDNNSHGYSYSYSHSYSHSPLSSLPKEVFQKLTDLDKRKIDHLSKETDAFISSSKENINADFRRGELMMMKDQGRKCELESLNWLGMDFMSNWIGDILRANLERIEANENQYDDDDDDNDNNDNNDDDNASFGGESRDGDSVSSKYDPRLAI